MHAAVLDLEFADPRVRPSDDHLTMAGRTPFRSHRIDPLGLDQADDTPSVVDFHLAGLAVRGVHAA